MQRVACNVGLGSQWHLVTCLVEGMMSALLAMFASKAHVAFAAGSPCEACCDRSVLGASQTLWAHGLAPDAFYTAESGMVRTMMAHAG